MGLIENIIGKLDITHTNIKVVSGGDISSAYCIETKNRKLFLKINDAERYPLMFEKEADGLQVLNQSSKLYVPPVISSGALEGKQYLLLEWLERTEPATKTWALLGQGLAELHRISDNYFGWKTSNYIGSLPQINDSCETWAGFYAQQRILPLVRQLFNNNLLEKNDLNRATTLCKNLDQIFPQESPSLLHGDLWNGNTMAISSEKIPAVFDPAVYFGHREMDIGMTLLFGGFDKAFYNSYNESYPLEKDWQKRIELTQLYPLLVHAILFQGSYITKSKSILRKWTS